MDCMQNFGVETSWKVSQGSSVSILTGLRTGRPAFNSRRGQGIFLFSIASRPALGTSQPLIQWVAGALSPGVK